MKQKKEFDFFDKPENIKKLWIMLYAICGLLIIPDLMTHRHAYFGFDSFFDFTPCSVLFHARPSYSFPNWWVWC